MDFVTPLLGLIVPHFACVGEEGGGRDCGGRGEEGRVCGGACGGEGDLGEVVAEGGG